MSNKNGSTIEIPQQRNIIESDSSVFYMIETFTFFKERETFISPLSGGM